MSNDKHWNDEHWRPATVATGAQFATAVVTDTAWKDPEFRLWVHRALVAESKIDALLVCQDEMASQIEQLQREIIEYQETSRLRGREEE